MFCPKCGTKLNGNEDFCLNCGNSLRELKELNNNQNQINDNLSIQQMQFNNNVKNSNLKKKKNNLIVIIGIFIFLVVIILIIRFVFNNPNRKYGTISNKSEISYSYSEGNIPKFIDGSFSNKKINSSSDVIKALEDIKTEMKFNDVSKELSFVSDESYDDYTYYRFNQMYEGIPVFNQNLIISVDKEGKIGGLSGYYIPNINISIIPSKNENEIKEIVINNLGENPNIESVELKVFADFDSSQLIYDVFGYSDTKILEYIIDANTGEIIYEIDIMDYSNTFSYTGNGMDNNVYTINLEEYYDSFNGGKNRYKFVDLERNIMITDYRLVGPIFSMLTSSIPISTPIVVDIQDRNLYYSQAMGDDIFLNSAVTTMYHFEKIYDYYKNKLGRVSFDNKGSKIIVNLGIKKKTGSKDSIDNAFWNSITNQMYIGDDKNGKPYSASLDVLAHEFTHGVIFSVSNFSNVPKDKNKAFETGALNEGYADIMGNLIEGKNWTLADNNVIVRDMSNPEKFNYPSVKGGEYYYPDGYLINGKTLEQFLREFSLEKNRDIKIVSDWDKGGVHNNSNVVSHAAYLMYSDGAFSSREQMAKVWYNSLFMLSSYSDFEDCALAVIKSAKNLGLSDSSIYKIIKAFKETRMLESDVYKLSGTISSGDENLSNVNINVYSYVDNSLITSTNTDSNGFYSLDLSTGTYIVKAKLDNFEEYETTIIINGKTVLDIELASSKAYDNKPNYFNNCKGSDCINLTVYFLDGNDNGKLHEDYEIYSIDKGTIIDANLIVDAANKALNRKMLSTDGKSFYISVGGFEVEFGWYYKGTDIKFDFNNPLNEDVEIEAKIFDGLVDNDTLIGINGLFN